ncbi:MAG: enoyl-CoA hydratase-related protein, partial [Microvirgula sp.]
MSSLFQFSFIFAAGSPLICRPEQFMPAFPATLYDDLRPALAHRGIMLKLESIAISVENQVAHLQLNRPDRANAMDDTLWRELHQAFDWASDTPEVRAVILSGNGKHFCAGIDLQMLIGLQQQIQDHCEARKREKLLLTIERLQRAVSSIEHCRKPVIAAIHGACVGGGLDIALAADIRLAADDAFFSVKEVEIGMVADLGTLQRLAG